ncbi:MAG: OmpA family protein [Bacteroidales bacterium]|nr:OmpA family protein [Bacteroidales bacterium]
MLLISVLVLGTGSMAAQDNTKAWFVGAGAGINVGFDGNRYESREASHIGGGDALDIYFGKFFGKVGGFRAGYQGLNISNQYTDYNKESFSYVHADFLARLADAFVPYVHAGYAHIFKGTPAAGVGLMMPVRIVKRVYIIPDGKLTFLNSNAFRGIDSGLGADLSATLGIRVTLEKADPAKKAARIEARKAKAAAKAAAAAAAAAAAVAQVAKDAEAAEAAKAAEAQKAAEAAKAAEAQKAAETAKAAEAQKAAEEAAKAAAEEKAAEAVAEKLYKVVYFDTNFSTIKPEAAKTLDEVAAFMKKYPAVKASVEGHADATGGDEWNNTLSGNRAQAVIDYLVGKGIPASSFIIEGFGERRPAADNSTKEGRAKNRRVEIRTAE